MARQQSSLRSIALLSLCSFGYLVLQFVLQRVLAHLFGTQTEMRAYTAVREFPLVLSAVLVGSLNYAFVPIFIERREKLGADAAWKTAGSLGAYLLLLLSVLTGICLLAAKPLVSLLFPGFSGNTLALAIDLFRILVFLTLANGLISFLQAIHYSQRRFLPPAIALLASSVVTVVLTLLLHQRCGIFAVAYGVLSGAVVAIGVQLPLFLRHCRLRFAMDDGIRHTMRLLLPLVLGAAYYKLDPLVDRNLASRMPTECIPRLAYSGYITNALLMLTTNGLAIVIFPSIIQHAATGRFDQLKAELRYAFRFLAFVLTPVVIGLCLFSKPVVHDLLESGEFTGADTNAVSLLVVLYAGLVVGGSLGEISAKVFYALNDTRTPVLIGVCGFTLGLIMKFLLAPKYGVAALVATTSAYYLFNAAWMLLLIRRRLDGIGLADVIHSLGRCLIGSTVATGAAYLVIATGFEFASFVAAAVGLVVYCSLMYLLGDEFAIQLYDFICRTCRSKQNSDPSESAGED